jgi:hypothetical protein
MTTAIKRAFDDEDTIETTPDTSPDTADEQSELVEAVEWLKRAGIVSAERPPFEKFFEELVEPKSSRVTTELSASTRVKKASNDD